MSFTDLLSDLSEQSIAHNVTNPFNEARVKFVISSSNTVPDIDTYYARLAEFYSYMYSECVSKGGRISPADARSFGKEIVERESRRKGGNLLSSFHNCRLGLHNGLRGVYDMICEALKEQAVDRFVLEVIDRHVSRCDFGQKKKLVAEMLVHWGPFLPPDITTRPPEEMASSYDELAKAVAEAIKLAAAAFRRL